MTSCVKVYSVAIAPNSQKNEMEPILFELAAGASSDKDMPHEGEEFGYVLEGKIMVVYGNKTVVCKKGVKNI